jgi:hypothetical protein
MQQQKGMKRAAKVASRKRKLVVRAKNANLRREVRKAELAEKEMAEKAK